MKTCDFCETCMLNVHVFYREQNTWEPMENLETCKHLLKDFEASLVKEQALKNAANSQKQAALQNQLHKKKTSDIVSQPGPSGIVNSLGYEL